jgi:hypothetical protein
MQSPASIRMVELDPATGKPKRRTWHKPTVRRLSDLNLAGTQKVLRLYEVARVYRNQRHGDAVFVRSLRLVSYAANLNDAIEGKIVPDGTALTGREPAAVGELDEQRSRRANIENVASGCVRCIEAQAMGEALARLNCLFGDLGIEWDDRPLTSAA